MKSSVMCVTKHASSRFREVVKRQLADVAESQPAVHHVEGCVSVRSIEIATSAPVLACRKTLPINSLNTSSAFSFSIGGKPRFAKMATNTPRA